MLDLRAVDRNSSNAEKYKRTVELFGSEEILPMWIADMDLSSPTVVINAIEQRLKHPILGYEMFPQSALDAQISWFGQHHNVEIKAEWIRISPSVVASLSTALRAVTNDGDEVLVMDPVYSPFYSVVKENNRVLRTHLLEQESTGRYIINLDRLEQEITSKTKAILLCSPHNPIGRVWSKEELNGLAQICLKKQVMLICDEIHCDLVYSDATHHSMLALAKELQEYLIVLIGPGKTFNLSGLGISSVVIMDEKLRKKYDESAKKNHCGEGNVLSNVAFEAAYSLGFPWYEELMKQLHRNRERLIRWMNQQSILKWYPPEGTYLAWINCSNMGLSDHDIRHFFSEKAKLGLSPGRSFGIGGRFHMRLNFAVSSEVLENALERIEKGFRG